MYIYMHKSKYVPAHSLSPPLNSSKKTFKSILSRGSGMTHTSKETYAHAKRPTKETCVYGKRPKSFQKRSVTSLRYYIYIKRDL